MKTKNHHPKKDFIFLLCYRLTKSQFLWPKFFQLFISHLFYSPLPFISLRFALSICSWNQLTVNLFSGMSTSPGSLPFDWPFNPVVEILPRLTDSERLQFVCFKVLPGLLGKSGSHICFVELEWYQAIDLQCDWGLEGKMERSIWNNRQVHSNLGLHPHTTPYHTRRTRFRLAECRCA